MPSSVAPGTLQSWLTTLEKRHPKSIELGLERVRQVQQRLELNPGVPIITVGGTNGKGSTVAYLESMLQAAGYRTGVYTSPHLVRFNERIRLDQREAEDTDIVTALDAVEAARGNTSLTYFEHTTLAAVWLFQRAKVDVMVLEVGLGGRLDAVNLFDADAAIVTSVDLDHMDYLGADRETIGFEKAGIFRAHRPAICTDPQPPTRLLDHARQLDARLWRLTHEIQIEAAPESWRCRIGDTHLAALPYPAMPGRYQLENAAAALAALDSLRDKIPVPVQSMRIGLATARVAGRFQILGQHPLRIVDVAHNPHAARALASNLADLPPHGITRGVLGMFADKDCEGVIAALQGQINEWHVAPLPPPRGADAQMLCKALKKHGLHATEHPSITSAWNAACQESDPADTIVAFGSFQTVADILIKDPWQKHP